MTEEEAKTKWCPFVRAITGKELDDGTADAPATQPSFNRVSLGGSRVMTPDSAKCIGSACMAWRWFEAPGETMIEAIKRHRNDHHSSLFEAKTYVEAHPEYRRSAAPESGFCGLAGKP